MYKEVSKNFNTKSVRKILVVSRPINYLIADYLIAGSAVKQVNQDVDRSRDIIVFGVDEDQNEKPEQKVLAILDKIEEKPQISGCVRLGQIKPGVVRPLRFRVRSQDNVYQILRKASTSRNFEDLKKVFLSPDRTVEERVSRKKLVIELREKRGSS